MFRFIQYLGQTANRTRHSEVLGVVLKRSWGLGFCSIVVLKLDEFLIQQTYHEHRPGSWCYFKVKTQQGGPITLIFKELTAT
jgi:hypothetical protein